MLVLGSIPSGVIAHVTCKECKSQSVITYTLAGVGYAPLISDLTNSEIKKFFGKQSISVDELIQVHKLLKKKPIWKLLEIKEHNLVKKIES